MPWFPRFAYVVLAFLATVAAAPAVGQQPPCDPDNAGLTLPEGFCALEVVRDLGAARHLTVAANGDLFVALNPPRGGGETVDFAALRDTDGDGRVDVVRRFGTSGGTGIRLRDRAVYFASHSAVIRYPWNLDALEPAGSPDTLVSGLPDCCGHAAKGFALTEEAIFVNVGSPSNACEAGRGREPGAAGLDPCPQLETRAGIWRFDLGRVGQTRADGIRFATGLRNTFALAVHPETGVLYGVQHGRDQLHQLWPALFTEAQSAELPAEEMVQIEQGDDFGWPYCYYDPELGEKVLAPEYGGDGRQAGRCEAVEDPVAAFPAHWGPNALAFYDGAQFPARYRGGAFIAFHGSWNRAPLPQGGYNVVFLPFSGAGPSGPFEVFAEGFAGATVSPRGAAHRPAGLAVGPDGSLYVADDRGGTVYRIMYAGVSR